MLWLKGNPDWESFEENLWIIRSSSFLISRTIHIRSDYTHAYQEKASTSVYGLSCREGDIT